MPKLLLVYGVIADPPLLIMEFEKVIRFHDGTQVFGVLAATRPVKDFIFPSEFDEHDLFDQYKKYLNTIVAEVIEVEGDLVSPSKRHAWEKRLRRQEPRMMVGLAE